MTHLSMIASHVTNAFYVTRHTSSQECCLCIPDRFMTSRWRYHQPIASKPLGNNNFHHCYSPSFSVAAPSQSTAIAQEVRFIAKLYPQIRITCSSIGGSISSVSSSSSISSISSSSRSSSSKNHLDEPNYFRFSQHFWYSPRYNVYASRASRTCTRNTQFLSRHQRPVYVKHIVL